MAVAPEMEQYLEAFIVEASEELSQIQACLERLRREGAKLVIVEEAARATANLKNAAATMGFRSARDLAHATWDMLNAWRRGGVKKPATSLELLALAHRRLGEGLKMLKEGRGPEPSAADLIIQLRALVTEDAENPWPEAEPSTATKDPDEQRFIVKLVLERPCPHPVGRFLVCQGYLLGLGRVINSDPPPGAENDQDEVVLRFLLATPRNVLEVRRTIESIPHVAKVEVTPATPEVGSLPPLTKTRRKFSFQDWTLHVEARYLEDLSEIAAHLTQIRSGYRAIEHEIQASNPSHAYRLSRLGDRFDYPLRQLSELVIQLRQIPSEFVLSKLVAFAVERGKVLGKEVDVKVVGGDTALGVDQAEALLFPMEELVGIILNDSAQAPEARQSIGKPRKNRLELTAQAKEAKITLSLSDDGGGMDLERELGPAGRLAEIRRKLEAVGATLDGESWSGQGTLLNIEISPPGNYFDVLALELGNDLFALPLASVVEARRATDETIVRIDGRTYLPQNREMVPLYDLATILGRQAQGEGGFWLFIRTPEERFILRAPAVLGSRQVALRPNAAGLQIPGLGGVCTDGGGRIYFLLSLEQLVKLAASTGRTVSKVERGSMK